MKALRIDHELTRGDTCPLDLFRLLSEGEVIELTEKEQLYFTIKESYDDEEYIIQKTLGNGIEKDEEGYYSITLEPSDTENLEYKDYVYDIQFVSTDTKVLKLTIMKGTIRLTEEATWKENE